jgi:hypothetical protein
MPDLWSGCLSQCVNGFKKFQNSILALKYASSRENLSPNCRAPFHEVWGGEYKLRKWLDGSLTLTAVAPLTINPYLRLSDSAYNSDWLPKKNSMTSPCHVAIPVASWNKWPCIRKTTRISTPHFATKFQLKYTGLKGLRLKLLLTKLFNNARATTKALFLQNWRWVRLQPKKKSTRRNYLSCGLSDPKIAYWILLRSWILRRTGEL